MDYPFPFVCVSFQMKKWKRKLEALASLEIRLGTAGSPYVPWSLLTKKTRAEAVAAARTPSQLQQWEAARREGNSIVSSGM